MPAIRTTFLHGLLALGLILAFQGQVHAQQQVGLRITSLTSAERDSTARVVQASHDLRLIYACVPAGILIFATDARDATSATVRTQAEDMLLPVIGDGRVASATITLEAAEQACQNMRGQ